MARQELKVEECFLKKAGEEKTPLRLSLANGEKLTGVVSMVGRYDIRVESGGSLITLPKKEILHILPERALLDDAFFTEAPEPDAASARSKVQNEFLGRFVAEKTLALLCMLNGEELRGVVQGFDGFTLALKTGRGQALLYKHGLRSIGPGYRRRTVKEDAR